MQKLHRYQGRRRGVDWGGLDMSAPLLPEVVPEIDHANPVSFYWGRGGVGQVWSLTRQSLPYVNFNDNVVRDDAAGDDNTELYTLCLKKTGPLLHFQITPTILLQCQQILVQRIVN